MKRTLSLLLLPLLALADETPAPGAAWLTDAEAAFAKAGEAGRPVLAVFEKSDVCPVCQKLESEVLATPAFADWAKSNVVLLKVDSTAAAIGEAKKSIDALVAKHKVKSFPTALLLAADGNEVDRIAYAPGGREKWLRAVEKATAKGKALSGAWITDWDQAKQLAKETKRPILADFTGSDWCGWCKRLKAEVFDTAQFRQWAAKKVILVELDYPRGVPQSDELKAQNDDLKRKFQIQGYPTILFLDAKEKILGRYGYDKGGPGNWISKAESMLK